MPSGSPTAQEAQRGRQEGVAEAACVGGSSPDPGSLFREANEDGTDSDRDSINSAPASEILPVIIPGTVDEII
ncbi:hypothetical protein NDU88_004355 [Pleurodeles waltl]|uniref:Uncharacterized protein n=1 Tax=Pleurodeles waltl TaxID=8319 RepID=A0AAV7NJG6_PLEWA|nr:hypothetical protein NDU88_004355 [Pleurodeles waltl]